MLEKQSLFSFVCATYHHHGESFCVPLLQLQGTSFANFWVPGTSGKPSPCRSYQVLMQEFQWLTMQMNVHIYLHDCWWYGFSNSSWPDGQFSCLLAMWEKFLCFSQFSPIFLPLFLPSPYARKFFSVSHTFSHCEKKFLAFDVPALCKCFSRLSL